MKIVVIIQRRPSWYRMVGANTPPDVNASVPRRSSCEVRSSALPTWVQATRSGERKMGTPGKYVNDDTASTYPSPTRHTLGSGWNPGMTGLRKPPPARHAWRSLVRR